MSHKSQKYMSQVRDDNRKSISRLYISYCVITSKKKTISRLVEIW